MFNEILIVCAIIVLTISIALIVINFITIVIDKMAKSKENNNEFYQICAENTVVLTRINMFVAILTIIVAISSKFLAL